MISEFNSSSIVTAHGGLGIEDVTPQSKYGLRSVKDESQDCSRTCSLPPVCFANCDEIWDLMCKMDLKYQRNPDLFKDHPILGPQMRAILLDWIMDVCEAYKMHRETLYLAIDYLDRYLAVQKNVPKAHLQLIGITCLFVAAKLEEIYPPKLKTFAYVTDGACSEAEILDMELVLMKTLKWKLTPITPATWVNIYLQILAYRNGAIICTRSGADFIRSSIRDTNKPSDARLIKHLYDRIDYVRIIRLVDLSILDAQSLNFTYSLLSAAAIFHTKGRAAALSASGFSWDQIATCVNWMAPAATVLRRHEIPPVLPAIDEVSDESRHLIQSHCVTLEMLNDAEALATSKICSPLNTNSEGGLLTPPHSGEKSGFPRRAKQSQSPRY